MDRNEANQLLKTIERGYELLMEASVRLYTADEFPDVREKLNEALRAAGAAQEELSAFVHNKSGGAYELYK